MLLRIKILCWKRKSENWNIYILSDNQAAIKALGTHQITSKLVWDCHQFLTQLAKHNIVQMIWVPGHESIAGNETADQLARTGSEHPFIGPGPGVARKRSGTGLTEITKKHWESTTGLKEAKGFISGPSAKRTKDLYRTIRFILDFTHRLVYIPTIPHIS
jgi:hypothetical protein